MGGSRSLGFQGLQVYHALSSQQKHGEIFDMLPSLIRMNANIYICKSICCEELLSTVIRRDLIKRVDADIR